MSDFWLDPVLYPLLLLGLGGPALGLARFLGWRCLGAGLAVLAGAGAALVVLMGISAQVWLPAAALAVGYGLTAGAARYPGSTARLLGSPRLAGAALMSLGLVAAAGWVAWTDRAGQSAEVDLVSSPAGQEPMPEPAALAIPAYTDRGQQVSLFTRPDETVPPDRLGKVERRAAAIHSLALIRTADADSSYNCHGWIFTAGRFWVRSEAVESILHDNGYQPVQRPQGGDLVVYRDIGGKVIHSGLVRLVDEELTLVESKWGHIGRFIHPVAQQPYGESWSFYRSDRRGHLIQIGEPPSVDASAED